jgi:hypothetical protein
MNFETITDFPSIWFVALAKQMSVILQHIPRCRMLKNKRSY